MKKSVTTILIGITSLINSYAQISPCNITLSSGSSAQTVCLGSSVTYTTYDSQNNLNVNGLPPGVAYQYRSIMCCCAPCPSSYVEITDTARASGVYTYTVVGSYCTNSATVTGTINVSTSGSCYRNCFANYTTTYDTAQNQFTLLVDPAVSATNFSWDFGDGTTSTLVQPTHTFPLDTTYNVCLTATTSANNTCTYCHKIGKNHNGNIFRTSGFSLKVVNTQNIAAEIPTEASTNTTFIVSPNPTSGQSEIRFNKSVKNVIINIYNFAAQKIIQNLNFSGTIFNIDLTNQPLGMYIIEVIQANNNVSKSKIILQ